MTQRLRPIASYWKRRSTRLWCEGLIGKIDRTLSLAGERRTAAALSKRELKRYIEDLHRGRRSIDRIRKENVDGRFTPCGYKDSFLTEISTNISAVLTRDAEWADIAKRLTATISELKRRSSKYERFLGSSAVLHDRQVRTAIQNAFQSKHIKTLEDSLETARAFVRQFERTVTQAETVEAAADSARRWLDRLAAETGVVTGSVAAERDEAIRKFNLVAQSLQNGQFAGALSQYQAAERLANSVLNEGTQWREQVGRILQALQLIHVEFRRGNGEKVDHDLPTRILHPKVLMKFGIEIDNLANELTRPDYFERWQSLKARISSEVDSRARESFREMRDIVESECGKKLPELAAERGPSWTDIASVARLANRTNVVLNSSTSKRP